MDNESSSLADVRERVLDKGVVIVGDITVNVMDIELLTLRLRLFIASAQTATEMGMDWWTGDSFFAPHAARAHDKLEQRNTELRERITLLEKALGDDRKALARARPDLMPDPRKPR